MAKRDPKQRESTARQPLTRERALTAAMELADAQGIESLTMRKLAQQLGVEAMSLYYHVKNKDDILGGIVDMVYCEIELPEDDDDWMTAMLRRGHSLREVMVRHPWAISVMEAQTAPGPCNMRQHDAVIESCLKAGFSIEMTGHAFALIDSYIYGFVLQEVNLPFDDTSDMEAVIDMLLAEMQPELYPSLTRLTTDYVLQPGYSYGNEFGFGLNLILVGLEAAARA